MTSESIMEKRSSRGTSRSSVGFIPILESQKDPELDRFLDATLVLRRNGSKVSPQLSHESMDELWAIVHRLFEFHRGRIFSSEFILEDPEHVRPTNGCSNTMTPDLTNQAKDESLQFVSAIVKKMQEIVSETEPYIPPSVVDILFSLQSFLMPTVIDINPTIKNEIVRLFELWWQRKHDFKATMCLLAFSFLLAKTSQASKSVLKCDITRVWKFRESLSKLQLESIGCRELLQTLSGLPANTHYLKTKDGCNFIAFLFTLQPELVKNLHTTVKQVLPTAKLADAETWGHIYTTAWTKASPEMRSVIEEICVQNFMLHIFTIQRQGQEMSRLGQYLLIILSHFHHYPAHPQMQRMLATLYEPLLWRFLSSANNLHRCSATQVFFSAYPLKCPVAGAEARTMYEEKQHRAISNLLTDSCHIVRIIAVKEVFVVMELYWLSLPPECIQGWMKTIVSELALDSSCADVRRHVFLGFERLLNNVQALDYVKDLLPKLRLLIHDVNERVRMAFLNLLIKLKNHSLPYWTFVPLRHLAARLEVDDRSVGELIVKLLVDSVCGPTKTQDQKIRRIMSFFILNQGAGRNFFYYSKHSISTNDAVELIIVILRSIKLFVKTCLEQDKSMDISTCSIAESPIPESRKGRKAEDKENINSGNVPDGNTKKSGNIFNTVSLENPVILQGFLDVVGILWTIHITSLSEEQVINLNKLCTECMPSFLSFLKGTDFYSSVLYLASLVPSKAHTHIFHITSSFMSQLKQLTPNDDDDAYMALVQPLCAWDRGGDLLDIVQEWLLEAFNINHTSLQMSRSTRKRVTFRNTQESKPDAALKILSATFCYVPNQRKILNKNYDQLLQLWTEMAQVKDLIAMRIVQGSPLESHLLNDAFLQGCLLRYAKLIPILYQEGGDFDCWQEYMSLLEWARETLIPHVPVELPAKGCTTVPLVVAMLRDLNCVAVNILMLGIDEPRFCMRVAAYSKALTNTGCGLMFVFSVCRVIGQLLDLCKSGDGAKDSMKLMRVVIPSLLVAMLSVLHRAYYPQDYVLAHVEKFSHVKAVITDVLESCQKFYGPSNTLLEVIMEKFAVTVIGTYVHYLQQTKNAKTPKTLPNLPYVTSQLVGISISQPSLSKLLAKKLAEEATAHEENDVKSKAVASLMEIMAAR